MLDTVQSNRAKLLIFALTVGLLACHGGYTRAPYDKARPPLPVTLLAATHPRIDSLRVQSGKIQQNHRPFASLLLIAQNPKRIRATIHFAGQEILSLAVNENSYGLRNLQDQNLQRGYYHGPPADCAVSQLLGIALPSEDLVRLILGGGPKLPLTPLIVEQSWSGKNGGFEQLVVQDGEYQRELRFTWIENTWTFQGMTTRKVNTAISQKRWEWSLNHERFTLIEGNIIPTRTVISRPNRHRRTEVKIVFDQVQINPNFSQPEQPSQAHDVDDWDDDDWENNDDQIAASSPPPDSEITRPSEKPLAHSDSSIPMVFVLDSPGLVDQGDLCWPK